MCLPTMKISRKFRGLGVAFRGVVLSTENSGNFITGSLSPVKLPKFRNFNTARFLKATKNFGNCSNGKKGKISEILVPRDKYTRSY